MNIKPIFAWYDIWVGLFFDVPKLRLYFFYFPMCGIVIQFSAKPTPSTPTPSVDLTAQRWEKRRDSGLPAANWSEEVWRIENPRNPK